MSSTTALETSNGASGETEQVQDLRKDMEVQAATQAGVNASPSPSRKPRAWCSQPQPVASLAGDGCGQIG